MAGNGNMKDLGYMVHVHDGAIDRLVNGFAGECEITLPYDGKVKNAGLEIKSRDATLHLFFDRQGAIDLIKMLQQVVDDGR